MKGFKTNALISILVVTSFITTTTFTDSIEVYARNYVSQNSKLMQSESYNKKISHDTKYATGAKSLTKQDKQWLKENAVDTKTVALNEIGLKRINKVKAKKGLKTIDSDKAVKVGNEVVSENSPKAVVSSTISDTSNLPESVDNSELPYFPAIGSQIGGSCVSFSTTYYQATYMNALQNDWNIKNTSDKSKIFSTKWTYNFINNGKNDGSFFTDAYKLFKEQGIATQKDFPYSGDTIDSKSYLEWPTNPQVWKNAAQNRLDKLGYVDIYDGTKTPIKNVNSPSLTQVKQLLNDGYVLSCSAAILGTTTGTVKDNPNSKNDDRYVGEKAIYASDGSYNHGMAVVGYNDDIWVDMNGDNIMQDGEKGAFKVANSWGSNYGNNGFIWVSYDAFNKVSSLKNPPKEQGNRDSFIQFDELYWMTMKASNTPKLLVQVDINTAYRKQLNFQLGYSEVNETKPQVTWLPQVIDNGGQGEVSQNISDCSFDGSKTPSDGTVVLDYSNFISNDLGNSSKRWYIRVADTSANDVNKVGSAATIKGFKFIDPSCTEQDLSPTKYDYEIDGTKASLDADYKLSSTDYKKIDKSSTVLSMVYKLNSNTASTQSQWKWKKNLPTSYENIHKMISYKGKIYTICTDANDSKTKVLQYDPDSNLWSVYGSYSLPDLGYDIFILNGKIYDFTSYGYNYTVPREAYVYDIEAKTWSKDDTISLPKEINDYTFEALNNKLYVIGGEKNIDYNWTAINSIWEYNPLTKQWKQKANMNVAVHDAVVSVAEDASDGKEKIYVLGGKDSNYNSTTNDYDLISNVQKYDPESDTWCEEGLNPYFNFQCYYDNTSSYYNNYRHNDGAAVALGNKIYMFSNESNDSNGEKDVNVYEYDTKTKVWQQRNSIPQDTIGSLVSAQSLNSKIYAVGNGESSNNFVEFDPLVKDVGDRVGIPHFSIPSGTYTNNEQLSINCSTPGAVIRYTTDGTEPNEKSPIYTEPITLNGKMTIKAIAMKDGCTSSYTVAASYDVPCRVNTPTFSIPSGTYKYGQQLLINCSTPGAVIRYTMDGTEPTKSSSIYTGSITISGKRTVKAIALKDGYSNSFVATSNYTAPQLIGDVNGDGKIDINDFMLIRSYVTGKIKHFPNTEDDMIGDVNGDGKVTAEDLRVYRDYLMGSIKCFPREQPITPTEISVKSTTSSGISLSWKASNGVSDIDHYEIYRDGKLIDTCKYNGYTDNAVTTGVKYSYTVVAVDSDGRKSAQSKAFVASTGGIG